MNVPSKEKYIYEIKNLSIHYQDGRVHAVKDFNLCINQNESVGILGESGSGKTSIALSMLGLLEDGTCSGMLIFDGEKMPNQGHTKWSNYRWKDVAIVFQNALNVLNPSLKVIYQVMEPLVQHLALSKEEAVERAKSLLTEVGLEHIWWHAKPNQLSGGMRQKVLIAMALACRPKVLILDEPTMSLDTESKNQVVSLIQRLKKTYHFSLLVISHEMKLIETLCDRVQVVYEGHQVEMGKVKMIFDKPKHPYTKGLMLSSWELDSQKDIWGIPHTIRDGDGDGCPFYSRCFQARDLCKNYRPSLDLGGEHSVACARGGIATIMKAKKIHKTYAIGKSKISAVNDVSFDVKEGEILALVGHSGSGKSTLAAVISGIESYEGDIEFNLENIKNIRNEGGVQLVTQDPSAAMNLDWKVIDVLLEPLKHLSKMPFKESVVIAKTLLEKVNLPEADDFLNRRAKEISGGQKQRLSIARALSMAPKLLIADEITAMLDPSSAANIVRLLKGMQNRNGFAMIYITHDLHLARKIADRVIVMSKGQIVKEGTAKEILCKREGYLAFDESTRDYEQHRDVI